MLQHVVVDRADDPRLADYIGLRDQELRRATEARGGLFIAEGINVLRRLLTSSYQVRSIVLGPHRYESLGDELSASVRPETPVYVVPRDVLVEVAGFDIHRGVVASAERGVPGSLATVSMSTGPIVALEGLTDHENVGAIARAVRAFGAKGMILDRACADPLYRRVVRVSMGEMLHLPWCRVEVLTDALATLRADGWVIGALTPAPDAISIHDWSPPLDRTVLLLGTEGPGLSAAAMASSDVRVRIPIEPDVDSLNVGHATSVALALLRQAAIRR